LPGAPPETTYAQLRTFWSKATTYWPVPVAMTEVTPLD
jgi:hypothetical protein